MLKNQPVTVVVKSLLLISLINVGAGCGKSVSQEGNVSALHEIETRVFDLNDANQDHFSLDLISSEIGQLTETGITGTNYQIVDCDNCDSQAGFLHQVLRERGILAMGPWLSAIGIKRFRPNALVKFKIWNMGVCEVSELPGKSLDLTASSSQLPVTCTDAEGAVTIRFLNGNGAKVLDSLTIPVKRGTDLIRTIELGPRAKAMREGGFHSVDDEWIWGDMDKIMVEVLLEGGHMGGNVDAITIQAEYDYR